MSRWNKHKKQRDPSTKAKTFRFECGNPECGKVHDMPVDCWLVVTPHNEYVCVSTHEKALQNSGPDDAIFQTHAHAQHELDSIVSAFKEGAMWAWDGMEADDDPPFRPVAKIDPETLH